MCLYLCGLAIGVEELVVIPAGERRRNESVRGESYRQASNPGLVLGSCVVPWVCLVLGTRGSGWMLACCVLASVAVLLWTAVEVSYDPWSEVQGNNEGEDESEGNIKSKRRAGVVVRVACVSLWIVVWCGRQLIQGGVALSVGSFVSTASIVAMFFYMRRLVPRTCTMGESLAISCAVVYVVTTAMAASTAMTGPIVAAGVLAFFAVMVHVRRLTSWTDTAVWLLAGGGAVALSPSAVAVVAVGERLLRDGDTLRLVAYWAVVLAVSLPCMVYFKGCGVRNIILRKGFHALALLLFVPPLLSHPFMAPMDGSRGPGEGSLSSGADVGDGLDPPAPLDPLPLAFAVAFVGFLALEIVRLGGIPLPFRAERHVHRFMAAFVDSRDTQGELYVTHITLLLGLAVPIWLGSGALMYTGIIAAGVGDAFASIVGSLRGPRGRPVAAGTNKTVEGTAACLVSMLLSWWALAAWYEMRLDVTQWVALAAVTAVSSLLESITDSWDNVFVSVHYFCLCQVFFRSWVGELA